MLTTGYLWEEYEKFWFFIMCHDWLNVSGYLLLIAQLLLFPTIFFISYIPTKFFQV